MMRIRALFAFTCHSAVFLLGQGPRSAFGQFDNLLKWVHGQPNAIVFMDVDALYKSPMAVEKQWKEKFATNWADNPMIIPPEANRIVVASRLDPLRNLSSEWELAVMELGEPVPLSSIARAEAGYIDTIDGTDVVWTPSHAYFVGLDKQTLGLLYPDNRQAVSRWLAFTKKFDTSLVSVYLRRAAQRVGVDGQIVMAIDLADAAQPHRLEKTLKDSPVLKEHNASVHAVTEVVRSIQGVTLAVNIGTQATGQFRVDFGKDCSILKPFAKQIVLEALEHFGAGVGDAQKWTTKVERNAIVLGGRLSEAGLRRIATLFELPTSKFSTLKTETKSESIAPNPTRDATKRYYGQLDKLISDLREGLKVKGTSTLWLEKSGRKIDALPILNVDEELLGFGAWCSKVMRNMAEGVRGVTRESNVSQSQVSGGVYSNGYGYGYGYQNPVRVSTTLGEQTTAAAGSIRTQGIKDITDGLADMRRKMTKKYSVEF